MTDPRLSSRPIDGDRDDSGRYRLAQLIRYWPGLVSPAIAIIFSELVICHCPV